jgi:hypothetical protein
MNNRRFLLHLIVGLLAFLIGVTAAVALGGFDPSERFMRSRHHRYQLMIPPQPLNGMSEVPQRSDDYGYGRPRTAERRYYRSLTPPPPPPPPAAPFADESEPLTQRAAPSPAR